MNEYHQQAMQWLRDNNIKLKITEASIQSAPIWAEGEMHGLKYECSMTGDRGRYTFNFWGSIADRQAGKKPSAYDVLACLDVWEGSIDEFVDEFGYDDAKTSKVLETYNAVIDQTLQLKHILPAKAIRELQEIN